MNDNVCGILVLVFIILVILFDNDPVNLEINVGDDYVVFT